MFFSTPHVRVLYEPWQSRSQLQTARFLFAMIKSHLSHASVNIFETAKILVMKTSLSRRGPTQNHTFFGVIGQITEKHVFVFLGYMLGHF